MSAFARSIFSRTAIRAFLILLTASTFATSARAFEYCVNNSATLNSALILASSSNFDDEIRLVQGTYTLSASQSHDVKGDLSLRGGWNAGCTLQSVNPVDTTITSAVAQANSLRLSYFSGSGLIERLHFSQMGGLFIREAGAYSSVTGDFRILQNRFSGNNFGLSVSSSSHDVLIQNNLFLNNDGTSGALAGTNLYLSGGAGNGGASIALDVSFNTLLGGRLGLSFFGGADYRRAPKLQNNIVRNASQTDLLLQNNIAVFASNNILGTRSLVSGATLSTDSQNLDVDPQLTILSYVPVTGSPAANSGTYAVSDGVPNADYDGSPRLIGIAPDRGAQESNIDNSTSLVVNNTADSGTGSLRQAIISANLNPDFKKITFNIPGSCPLQINLSSSLPAITKPVGIEGYTQPGSALNTQSQSFDGTVCVFLLGGNNISSGLRVQTQSVDDELTVRGLGFYGFSSEAIRISGPGKGSVRGNVFGTGLGLGGTGQNFSDAVIRVVDAPGTQIGSFDAADMNVIGGGDVVGVDLTVSVLGNRAVDGNLIGINRNGTTGLANGIGVRVADSDYDFIRENIISFNTSHAVTIGGTATRTFVYHNKIGSSLDSSNASGNGGNAVRILAGSGHRVRSNRVFRSASDGIVVLSPARANKLQINEFDGNQRQAIDLAPDGVNPIDLDVGQTGANDQQNYPLITDAVGSNVQGEVALNFSSANGSYAIELYASADCSLSAGGFTQAQEFLFSANSIVLDCATASSNCSKALRIPVTNQFLFGDVLIGKGITALAIDEEGNTSEISACRLYRQGDNLFKDGFE